MSGCVLVGGGTGFIGRNLIRLLKLNRVETLTVSRYPGTDRISWNDIYENGLPSGINSVVNLAGRNVLDVTKRWNDNYKNEIYKSRIITTEMLSDAINKSSVPPKAFVTISGVGIYPPSESVKYNENSNVKPFDYFSQLCHDWEKAANFSNLKGCRLVTIRSGVVLGRDGGMIKNLYLPFRLGLGGPIASGKQYLPWIHVDDLCRLIIFCINNDVTGVLNGVAPENITNKQFTQAFAKSLSRPAIFHVPKFVFNVLYGKERAIMVTQGQCVVPKRTLEVGFKFEYPDIQTACNLMGTVY